MVRMDGGSTKSEENARYSFLLGSALRYEDTEQFLQVYDAVVPKNFPSKQVEAIKELARKIADLPQEEFNALASKAQLSSEVGPAGIGMSALSADLQAAARGAPDEDVAHSPAHPTKHSPGTDITTKKRVSLGPEVTSDGEHLEEVDESDSGVFNSSKNTTGSMSDDTEMADEYERRGVICYFPQHAQSPHGLAMDNMELQRKNNNAYDDAELVPDSDEDADAGELLEVVVDKNHDPTIQGGIAVKTFRMEATAHASDTDSDKMVENLYVMQHNNQVQHLNTLQYDEAVSVVDDDDEEEEVIPHQQLLGRNAGRFSSMQREDSEDYEAESPESRYTLTRRIKPSKPKASDGVRIEQDVRQRRDVVMPPFGDPLIVDKVNKSAERLIDFNSSLSQDVKNMPPAERIRNNMVTDKDSESNNTETATKKKRKKKKSTKEGEEEGNRNQKDSSMDINGNPTTDRNPVSTTRTKPTMNNYTSAFPRSLDQLSRTSEMNGQSLADLEDSSSKDKEQKKSRATRRRDKEAAQMFRAEQIEGFQGHKDVDDLLSFIESSDGCGNNKKKKKVASVAVVNGNLDGGGGMPNGHVANDIISLTKNGKKVKQSTSKSRLLISQKDSEKSSEDTSEKTDDSSSGKSESDDVKETEVVVESVKTKTEPKALSEEPAQCVSSPSLQNYSSIKDLDDNDVFIFTDFENMQPLAEDEFKVVTRKKPLRMPAQPLLVGGHCKDQSRENHYYDPVYSGYSGYNSLLATRDDRGFREDRPIQRRGRPIVRSVTPPPTATTTVEKDHYYYQDKPSGERAFSPSAFPALGGMREGRRNSTGDVPSALSPDDSDMESVKSLPLVAGSAGGVRVEDVMSPIMSYAKIAAGPKTSNNKNGVLAAWTTNKSDPEPLSSDSGRRHSLPSLTDPLLEPSASEAACSTQTVTDSAQDSSGVSNAKPDPQPGPSEPEAGAGCPKTDQNLGSSIVAMAPEAVRTNNVDRGTRRQSSRSESDISENKDAVSSNVNKVNKVKSDTVNLTSILQSDAKSSGLTFGSGSELPAVPILDQQEFPAITEAAAVVSPPPSTASQPLKRLSAAPAAPTTNLPDTGPSSSTQQPKATAAPASSHNSNNKKQKNKSVVFLDRRARCSTPNLGISFGFDTNLEVVGSQKPAAAAVAGTEVTVAKAVVSSGPKPAPGPAPPAAVSVKQAVSGFNGLVLTPGLDTKVAPPAQRVAGGSEPAVIEPGVSGVRAAPLRPPATPTATTATTDNHSRVVNIEKLVPLSRAMDPNFMRGRFAVEEIACFLKEQWDHIMEKKNKNPGSVTHYSSQ